MEPKAARDLAAKISSSSLFKDYERAFTAATGLPLAFRPVETWQLAQRGRKNENPFCALMSQSSKSCALCLEVQEKIARPDSAGDGPAARTAVCFAGLYDSAVPVKLGDEVLGFLQTGQIALSKPSRARFNRVAKRIVAWGLSTDLSRVEQAWFHTRVLTRKQYAAMLGLLEVFARHLAISAEQIALQEQHAVAPAITKAKAFIEQNREEDITLGQVAKFVNVSTYHFCKMFKRATGFTFTEYLSLVRIAKAKNLLLNPHLHVSEIAYQIGFNSLTHFNRVFKKLVGQSPTAYRCAVRRAR